MRKEDACGSDRGCESPLKTGQHRNINNAQYTKGAKNPEKQHATASIDGASQWQKIRYLTIPSLVPTMMIMVLLAIGNIFRGDFGLFYQTVKSSALLQPYTDVIDTYVFRLLIDSSDYGVSSAAGLYQSILCFVTIMICNGIVKKLQPDYALY